MLSGINEKKHRINILDIIYPVGSVYLSVNATNPSAVMGGVWEEISQGRVLQGVATGETGGDTKEAGLPNITGQMQGNCGDATGIDSGALFRSDITNNAWWQGAVNVARHNYINFDASLSNSIYGASDTVQPPAFLVHIFQRTA